MNGWMMTGIAGMMALMMPGCGGMAWAQCGMPCGSQHGQARHEQKAPRAEAAQRAPRPDSDERQTLPPDPVTGEPIVLSIRTMTDDGPVYFSSEEARDTFSAAPQKYAEKAAAQRAALKKLPRVQVNCPVTGNPIDGKTVVLINGTVVDFCCEHCVPKYDNADNTERDRRRYAAKLEDSYTYQTRCPISGDPIDPRVYADIADGVRVYFCCAGDRDAFVKGLKPVVPATQPARERTAPKPETGGASRQAPEKRPAGHGDHGSHP